MVRRREERRAAVVVEEQDVALQEEAGAGEAIEPDVQARTPLRRDQASIAGGPTAHHEILGRILVLRRARGRPRIDFIFSAEEQDARFERGIDAPALADGEPERNQPQNQFRHVPGQFGLERRSGGDLEMVVAAPAVFDVVADAQIVIAAGGGAGGRLEKRGFEPKAEESALCLAGQPEQAIGTIEIEVARAVGFGGVLLPRVAGHVVEFAGGFGNHAFEAGRGAGLQAQLLALAGRAAAAPLRAAARADRTGGQNEQGRDPPTAQNHAAPIPLPRHPLRRSTTCRRVSRAGRPPPSRPASG